MRKETGKTEKPSLENLRYISKHQIGGEGGIAEEMGIHYAENNLFPALPPLSEKFRVPKLVQEQGLLAVPKGRKGETHNWKYEDLDVEVKVDSGDVALIGAIAEDRYHLDPETLLPISEGHEVPEFPNRRATRVTELALRDELTGDVIENIAYSLLDTETKPVQWAPRDVIQKRSITKREK